MTWGVARMADLAGWIETHPYAIVFAVALVCFAFMWASYAVGKANDDELSEVRRRREEARNRARGR